MARVWGSEKCGLEIAQPAKLWMERNNVRLENIDPEDLIIWISPGETILGHTTEYIGGRKSVLH